MCNEVAHLRGVNTAGSVSDVVRNSLSGAGDGAVSDVGSANVVHGGGVSLKET